MEVYGQLKLRQQKGQIFLPSAFKLSKNQEHILHCCWLFFVNEVRNIANPNLVAIIIDRRGSDFVAL